MAIIQQFNLQEYLARTRAAKQSTMDTGSGLDYNELLQQEYAKTNAPVGGPVQPSPEVQQQKQRQVGIIEAGYDTVVDFANNMMQGLWGLPEGIIDFLAGGVAGVGEAFGADTSGIKDFIQNTWADDAARLTTATFNIGGLIGDAVASSLTDGEFSFAKYAEEVMSGERYADGSLLSGSPTGEFVKGVAQGIGQLLPAIALAPLTGGLSLGAQSALQIGVYSLSAAGKGVEEALKSDAGIGSALAYGTLSGVVEGLIESFSGGVGGTLTGPSVGLLQKVMGKEAVTRLASNAIAKTAVNAMAEGFEEAVSEAINPLLRKWTYAPETEYDIGQVAANAATSFASSFISSFIVSGAQVMKAGQTTKINGKAVGANGVYAAQNFQQAEQKYEEEQKKLDPIIKKLQEKYGDNAFIPNEQGTFFIDGKRYRLNDRAVATYDQQEVNDQVSKIETESQNVKQWESELNRIWEKNGITKEDQTRESINKLDESNILLEKRKQEAVKEGKTAIVQAIEAIQSSRLLMKARLEGSLNTFDTVISHLEKNKFTPSKKTLLTDEETTVLKEIGYDDVSYKITYQDEDGNTQTILFSENNVPLNFIAEEHTKVVAMAVNKIKQPTKVQVEEAGKDGKGAITQLNKLREMFNVIKNVELNLGNQVLKIIQTSKVKMNGAKWQDLSPEDQQHTARVIGILHDMIKFDVSPEFTKILEKAFAEIVPGGIDKFSITSFDDIKFFFASEGYELILDFIGALDTSLPLDTDKDGKVTSLNNLSVKNFLTGYTETTRFLQQNLSVFNADFVDVLTRLAKINDNVQSIGELLQKKTIFELSQKDVDLIRTKIANITEALSFISQFERITMNLKANLKPVLEKYNYEDSFEKDATLLFKQDLDKFLKLPDKLEDVINAAEAEKAPELPLDERKIITVAPALDEDKPNLITLFVEFDGKVTLKDGVVKPSKGATFRVNDNKAPKGKPFLVVQLEATNYKVPLDQIDNEDAEATDPTYKGKRMLSELTEIPVEAILAYNQPLVKLGNPLFSTRLDVERLLNEGKTIKDIVLLAEGLFDYYEIDGVAVKKKDWLEKNQKDKLPVDAKRIITIDEFEKLKTKLYVIASNLGVKAQPVAGNKQATLAAPKSFQVPVDVNAKLSKIIKKELAFLADEFGNEILNDSELLEYLYLSLEVTKNEKSDKVEALTAEQQKLLDEGKSEEFSKSRGYTEEQIAQFKRYLELYEKLLEKYQDENLFFEFQEPELNQMMYDSVYGNGSWAKKQTYLNEGLGETKKVIKEASKETNKVEEKPKETKPAKPTKKEVVDETIKQVKETQPKEAKQNEEKKEANKKKWVLDPTKIEVTPSNQKTYTPIEKDIKIINFGQKTYAVTKTESYTNSKGNIAYAHRAYVILEYKGVKIPFYLSSGETLKAGVIPGRWYPFPGLQLDSAGKMKWIRKATDGMRAFYGIKLLRALSEFVQDKVGDVRITVSNETLKQSEVELTTEEIAAINEGFDGKNDKENLSRNIAALIGPQGRLRPAAVEFSPIYDAYMEKITAKKEQVKEIDKVEQKQKKDKNQKEPIKVETTKEKVKINIKNQETTYVPKSVIQVYKEPGAPKTDKVAMAKLLLGELVYDAQEQLNTKFEELISLKSEKVEDNVNSIDAATAEEWFNVLKNINIMGVYVFRKIITENFNGGKFNPNIPFINYDNFLKLSRLVNSFNKYDIENLMNLASRFKLASDNLRLDNLESIQEYNYSLKLLSDSYKQFSKEALKELVPDNLELFLIDTISKKGEDILIPEEKMFPKNRGFQVYQGANVANKQGLSTLTTEQLLRSLRTKASPVPVTQGQIEVLNNIEIEKLAIQSQLADPEQQGEKRVQLNARQNKYFKNGEYTETLRVALILYVRGQAPQTKKETKILIDFLIDFGIAQPGKRQDFLNEYLYEAAKDITNDNFYIIDKDKLPTYAVTIKGILGKYMINTVFQLTTQMTDRLYAGITTNYENSGVAEIVVNLWDFDGFNQNITSMAVTHELIHVILRASNLSIPDNNINAKIMVAKFDLINTMINIKNYLKSKGLWKQFLDSVRPYYENMPLEDLFNDNMTPQWDISIQEEAFAALFSFGLAFDYKANPFILSEILRLRRDHPILNDVLTWGERQDVEFNVKSTEPYKALQNIEAIKPNLEEKIKVEPIRPKITIKGKIKSSNLDFIITTQNAQAAIEEFFKMMGKAEAGRVAVNQARAAKNAGQQSISYGIFDRKSGRFLSKGLFGRQRILKTMGPGNQKPGLLDFLIGKDTKYFAKFATYAYLWHNIDRTDLKDRVNLSELKFQGSYTEKTFERIKLFIKNSTAESLQELRESLKEDIDFELTPEVLKTLRENNVIDDVELKDIDYQITYAKEIFGKFISIENMPEQVIERIKRDAPNLWRALQNGEILNQNDFHEFLDVDRSDAVQSGKDLKPLESLIKELEKTYMKSVNKEDSIKLIQSYEKENPEFKEAQKELVEWYDALLTMSVNAQLVSPAEAEFFRKTYKNYIPTIREAISLNAIKGVSGKTNLNVRNPIKTAKGSDLILESLDAVAARRTMFTHHAAQMNILMNEMYTTYLDGGSVPNDFILSIEQIQTQRRTSNKQEILESSPLFDSSSAGNFVTFYRLDENGDKVAITIKVSDQVYSGFKQLNNSFDDTSGIVGKTAKALNNGFKSLITNYNPIFIVRNFLRDIQDASFYSKYGFGKLVAKLPMAWRAMWNNEDTWQEYVANGGQYSTLFDYNEGIRISSSFARTRLDKGGKLKFLRKMGILIERANIFIEQGTRFAEYMLARESGKTIEQGILDANEVTVNFGRTGTLTQKLNSTVMPFLNPSVQGLDRQLRVFMSPKSAREWANLLLKLILLGILPQLINDIIYAGDDAYVNLPDYIKEGYYLVKVGESFVKIPKGRAVGSVQNVYLGIQSGKDIGEIAGNVWDTMNPTNNFRTTFSPFVDVGTNTTWYGGQIVSTKWQFTRPENQYTDKTSQIAILLGKVLKYSPLKIDYLLDQYGGVLYDVFANRQPINTLIADPTFTNDYSNKFFELLTDLNYDRTDGDVIARAQVSYLNRVVDGIGELYTKIEELNLNQELSDEERRAELSVVQTMINEAYNQAVVNVDKYGQELAAYELSEVSYDEDILNATRNVFGAEYALRYYSYKVHDKAVALNLLGFDFEQYYDYYFMMRTLEGKENKVKFINSLRASRQVKQILYKFAGYKTEEQTTQQLYRILVSRGLTTDAAKELLYIKDEEEQ
jgi:hypothetical protein